MSRNQIGKFIQQLRKEKGLTQKELGNIINVSDKTISKWENSNSIPDTAILPDLCNALDISVNELLYGEKLPPEDYSEKAKENIMNLLQGEQKSRKSELVKIILGGILLIAVFLADTKMIHADVTWYLDIWSLLVPTCIFVAVVLLSGARRKKRFMRSFTRRQYRLDLSCRWYRQSASAESLHGASIWDLIFRLRCFPYYIRLLWIWSYVSCKAGQINSKIFPRKEVYGQFRFLICFLLPGDFIFTYFQSQFYPHT